MHGGQTAGEASVHFFGPWGVNVARAQSGFDVSHRYAAVECGECGSSGGGCIAVYQHQVGFLIGQNLTHTIEDAYGDIEEVLTRPHDIKIVLRYYFK